MRRYAPDLIAAGLDRLPLPGAGHGATLERWRCLAVVAGHDLSLLKLYEGHTDALAILAELKCRARVIPLLQSRSGHADSRRARRAR